jgi:hypothetical protein
MAVGAPRRSSMSERREYSLDVFDTRLSGVERSIETILNRVDVQSTKTDASINAMREQSTQQMQAIRDTIAASKVPQWPVITSFFGLAVVIITALWGAGINPIKSTLENITKAVNDNSAAVQDIRTNYLTTSAYNENLSLSRQARGLMDERMIKQIEMLEERLRLAQEAAVPRGELQERWRSIDAAVLANREQFTAMLGDLQRQVDEMKKAQGEVYTARDIILDMQDRIDRLDAALRRAP